MKSSGVAEAYTTGERERRVKESVYVREQTGEVMWDTNTEDSMHAYETEARVQGKGTRKLRGLNVHSEGMMIEGKKGYLLRVLSRE